MPLQVCFSFPSLPFPLLSCPKASQYSLVEEQSAGGKEDRGSLHLPPWPDGSQACRPGRGAPLRTRRRGPCWSPRPCCSPGTRCGTWPVTQHAQSEWPATATLHPLWARPSSGVSVARLSPPTALRCSKARWPRPRPRPPTHKQLSCVPGNGGCRAGHITSLPLPPSPVLRIQESGWPSLGPALQGPRTRREGAMRGPQEAPEAADRGTDEGQGRQSRRAGSSQTRAARLACACTLRGRHRVAHGCPSRSACSGCLEPSWPRGAGPCTHPGQTSPALPTESWASSLPSCRHTGCKAPALQTWAPPACTKLCVTLGEPLPISGPWFPLW